MTAVVQPAIRSVETDNDGNRVTKITATGGCAGGISARRRDVDFSGKSRDECLVVLPIVVLISAVAERRDTGAR